MSSTGTSESTAALAPPTVADVNSMLRPWRISMGPVKAGVGACMLLAGAYGILSEQQFVASGNAVVSAYVISVRTPIEGTVSGLPTAAGVRVHEGNIVGRVENLRFDQQHMDNLRVAEEQARHDADALLTERATLQSQRQGLLMRASTHSRAAAARLRLEATADERMLAARQSAFRYAAAELERGRQLHQSGIISDAELEKLETQNEVVAREVEAGQAEATAARAEARSAYNGLMTAPGINDVAYSRQRADEIDLRLAETDRTIMALQAQARDAHEDLEAETRRTNLMRAADLTSPISGVLWKLDAMNGEHLSIGDPVVQFVDCSRAFVLVEIPQDRIPDVAIGAQTQFKLSGETSERTGMVASVSGDPPAQEETSKLAAAPVRATNERMATVRIALSPGDVQNECIVGRTARVLIPTRGTSFASRWLRQHF